MKNGVIAFALAAALGWLLLEGQPTQRAKPLTEPDLVYLLKNFVLPAHVAELAREKGIDFTLSPQQERELRQAGADDALINSLRELAPKPTPPTPVVEKLSAGKVRVNPKDEQRYVYIPPGSFLMGCSTGDSECFDEEKPQHRVTITKGFWMGQTAVTVDAWKRYRIATGTTALPTADNGGRKNWNEAGEGNMPAVMMTWEEAKSYCEWAAMRLPTEAEWEYAARAGTTSARYGDIDAIAWYSGNSGQSVHGVGLKQPNAWKLYDMLGNVWQWTADWYDAGYYARSESEDPLGPTGDQSAVVRGGSWYYGPLGVRVSFRGRFVPAGRFRNYGVGCRCVGELP